MHSCLINITVSAVRPAQRSARWPRRPTRLPSGTSRSSPGEEVEPGPGPSGLRALVPREVEAAGSEGSAAVEAEDSSREDSVRRRAGSERPPPEEEGSVHSSSNKAAVAPSEVIINVYFS